MNEVFKRFPKGGAVLATFLALAEASNDQGNCQVARHELAAASRSSEAAVNLSVRDLRADRWIVTNWEPKRGSQMIYQINVPMLMRSQRPAPQRLPYRPRTKKPKAPAQVETQSVSAAAEGANNTYEQ